MTTIYHRYKPGPTLLQRHRSLAIQRISRDLIRRSGGNPRTDPETWFAVAKQLGVQLCPQRGIIDGKTRARVRWDTHAGCWQLEYDETRSAITTCRMVTHELAHIYQHDEEIVTSVWLCDEPAVYYYEGPPWLEQHRIARRVELIVVR